MNAEIVQRLEQSLLRASAPADIAVQYMLAQQAYDARQGWVEVARKAIKSQMSKGVEPTAEKRREFDEWEAELVYMRRALDALRQQFLNFYKTDPDVEQYIQELEAEEQHQADSSAEDGVAKPKRKPKS